MVQVSESAERLEELDQEVRTLKAQVKGLKASYERLLHGLADFCTREAQS